MYSDVGEATDAISLPRPNHPSYKYHFFNLEMLPCAKYKGLINIK